MARPTPAIQDLTPIVVLRTDDADASWETVELFPTLGDPETLQNAIGYCTELALPITMAVPPDELDDPGMSTEAITAIIQGGLFEVASHAHAHPAVAVEQAISGYTTSLANSLTVLGNLGVTGDIGFIEPGDWHDPAKADTSCRADADRRASLMSSPWHYIRNHFAWGCGYFPMGWCVGRLYHKFGIPFHQEMDNYVAAMRTPAKILALLDVVAASPGVIFIPLFHAILANNADPTLEANAYGMLADTFKAMMDKVFALRAAGKVRVLTMSQAVAANSVNKFTNNLLADPNITQLTLGTDYPNGPWRGNVAFSATGGRLGGRCFQAAPEKYLDQYVWLEPGTYKWSWMQKKLSGNDGAHDTLATVQEMHCRAANPGAAAAARAVSSAYKDNIITDFWQEHSVTFRVEPGQTTFKLDLYCSAATWLWGEMDLRMVPPTRGVR